MTEPLQYRNWIREAREHWKEHRPKEYRRLQKEGKLESALREAAEATADEMATLTEQGFDHQQAWEMVRETYLYLPQEPRRRAGRALDRSRTGERDATPAESPKPSTANQSAERRARMEKIADGLQQEALSNFQKAADERRARTADFKSAPGGPTSEKLAADQIADEVQQMMLSNLRQASAERKARKQELTAASAAPSSTSPSADRRARTEAIADRLQQMALSNLRRADQEYLAREQASKPTSAQRYSLNPSEVQDKGAERADRMLLRGLDNFRKTEAQSLEREQASKAAVDETVPSPLATPPPGQS